MTPQPRGNAEDVSRKWKGAERLFKTVFCGRPSLWTYAGIRWTSKWPLCTSAGSRKALRARIRSSAANCRRCGGSSASKRPGPPFVFTSERSAPFTTAGFARMVERAGSAAKLRFKAHPHMLRHATGYALASRGHDTRALQAYLGHKNIQHTVRYTELSPTRFKNFWRE